MSEYERKLKTAKLCMILFGEMPEDIKKKEIIKCLDGGANINEQFVDDSNNTPLHVSVNNGDIDIVNLLLERGAKMNYKNIHNKTAIDLARELDSDAGRTIVDLLETYEAETQMNINGVAESNDILTIVKHDEIDSKLVYQKRTTATGIKGQLYETKLLSLVFIRASLNQEYDEFYLGTSLDGIGALDDICIRYKKDNIDGVVFLQAKHRSDVKKNKVTLQDLWRDEGDFSLQKYFKSYSMIREKFLTSNESNQFFKGEYDDLKCTFVIYTTAECDFTNKTLVDVDSIDKTARDLINSGYYSNIFKYDYNESDISLLTSNLAIDHMKYIGKILVYFISKGKYDMLMNDPHIRKYHVILARDVINVADVTPPAGHRIGTFRKDFFNNHNEKMVTLKMVLYEEFVLATKPNEKKMKEIIDAVKNNPSKETISTLMQNAVTRFDENKTLVIEDDRFKDVTIQRFRLSECYIMCTKALNMAVQELLETKFFKLPSTFGNIDIAVANGNKGEKRLERLAEKIERLFDCTKTEPSNIDPGFIALNGGLGSAVGNLLILNEQKTWLILNTDEKTLGKNARNLLGKLKSKIKNIDTVKFNPGMFGFYLTLDGNEIERHNARMFFNNLLFYTLQSNEEEIEEHAKDAIQDYCIANKHEGSRTASNAQYDAIYFIVHDEVQKWWMTDEKSYYLTNNRQYFDTLLKQFAGKSLLNVISRMFVNKMRKYDIKFNKDAIDCMSSQVGPEATILITEFKVLTGIKLAQCFHNFNKYAFIDLNDVTCLSKNDYNSIIHDLNSIKLKALIIFYEDVTEAKTKIFLRLTEKSVTNNYILVTNEKSAESLQLHIKRDTFVTLRDVRSDLNDLDLKSQEKVLESMFIFQGVSTNLSKIITHDIKTLIKSKILQKIINNETMYIGKTLSNPYYENIKYYYVQRSLRRQRSVSKDLSKIPFDVSSMAYNEELIKLSTLEELKDTVVIVGAPGMGKSTYLTYLSLQTKQRNPSIWIERINLLDQTKELHRLQENKIKINNIDALKFVCKAALSRNLIRFSIKPTPIINFDLEINNGEVVLKNCDEVDYLVLFELQLLIHSYNQGNTILLFDGFDEICPHYRKEMTEILKCLVTRWSSDSRSDVKQRMWITGRSYNNIRETLETEFCVSYNLEIFNNEEQEEFMYKYLKINMNLNELNFKEFKRIDGFFQFMKQFVGDFSVINSKKIIKVSSFFLYSLYKIAMKYFYVEINKLQMPDKKEFWKKWSNIFNSKSSCYIDVTTQTNISKHCTHKPHVEEAVSLIYTPLHAYIVLDYFENQIKNVKPTIQEDISVKWDLEMNTSSFYEHFIKMKMKKIRFEEKNQMDIYNPDIQMTYEKELKEFMNIHKKLAFYATFKDDLHEILTEEDIEEIRIIIENMEGGREKTGIVDCILSDGIPKFVHLSFQDYLAAEYISDLFKTSKIEHLRLWRFISSKTRVGVLDFFDRKLEFDLELINVIANRDLKQFIFDDLTLDRIKVIEDPNNMNDSILDRAINFGLKHIIKMFVKAMADVVTDRNIDKFVAFINKFQFFYFGASFGWDEILVVILQCIRRVDPSKLNECNFGILQTRSYNDFSNKEILRDIKWKIIKDKNRKTKTKTSTGRRHSI